MRWVAVLSVVSCLVGCTKSQELGERPDGGPARRFDSGLASMEDGGIAQDAASLDAGQPGMDAGPTPGEDAGRVELLPFRSDVTFQAPADIYGAASVGGGVLAVGKSDRGTPSRRHAVLYFLAGARSWGRVFDDGTNLQLFGIAQAGGRVLATGLTRGYSVTARGNDDVLLVDADETGVRRAYSWGTAEDELLFAITPGGAVAPWIGVGYYEPERLEATRDGLIVAFEADFSVRWAVALDMGGGEQLYAAAVDGDQVTAVGRQANGSVSSGIIATVDAAGEVRWAYRLGSATENDHVASVTVDPDSGYTIVGGNVNAPGDDTAAGAILSFDRNGGLVSGVQMVTGRYTRVLNVSFPRPGEALLHGSWNNEDSSFIATADASTFAVRNVSVLEDIGTRNFLKSPVLDVGGERRIIGMRPGGAVTIPVGDGGQVGCGAERVVPIVEPLATAPVPVTPSRRVLTLVGGPIAGFAGTGVADSVTIEDDPACLTTPE